MRKAFLFLIATLTLSSAFADKDNKVKVFHNPEVDGYYFLANTGEELNYASYPYYSSYPNQIKAARAHIFCQMKGKNRSTLVSTQIADPTDGTYYQAQLWDYDQKTNIYILRKVNTYNKSTRIKRIDCL